MSIFFQEHPVLLAVMFCALCVAIIFIPTPQERRAQKQLRQRRQEACLLDETNELHDILRTCYTQADLNKFHCLLLSFEKRYENTLMGKRNYQALASLYRVRSEHIADEAHTEPVYVNKKGELNLDFL